MDIYYSSVNKAFDAKGIVEDGTDWIVCRGSIINPVASNSIGKEVKFLREEKGIVVGNILQKDIHFKSATKAAQFVCGYSTNGMSSWKTEDGELISKYITGNRRKPIKKH